jgi:simple sugar transport system substrate-binding protein
MKSAIKRLAVGTAIGATLLAGSIELTMAAAPYTMVTVVKLIGVNWFARMDEGIKKFAADTGNHASMIGPPTADAALQVQEIEDLIAKKVNAIGVVPNSPEALEPVLKKAMSRGIVVIGHEGASLRNVDYDVEAFDNAAYGEHLMKALAKGMGEEGKYAVFVGHLTAKSHNEWVDAAIAYQKAHYPKMQLVSDRIESNEDQEQAYAKTKELLRAHPDLKGIEGSAATDVAGAGLAIQEAGLGGKITVVGTSLPSVSGKLLESGAITMISFWDPALAGYVMDKVAVDKLEGKPITDGMDLGVTGYDKVALKGHVIYGQAWVDVTKDNMKDYPF